LSPHGTATCVFGKDAPIAERTAKSILRTSAPGRRLAPAVHRAREIAFAGRAWLFDKRAKRQERIRELSRGLPLPPPLIRTKVIRNGDARHFLASGKRQHHYIVSNLRRNKVEPRRLESIYDFGCGCGRNLRWWWPEFQGKLTGSDIYEPGVRWVDENLPFVDAAPNGALPPTRYQDASFDFIYAISIWTHFPEERQRPWMEEMVRLLRPGGHLLFTVAGTAYRDTLPPGDGAAFDRGELVVQFDDEPGSNLCAVYHPERYVTERLIRPPLELVDFIPGDAEARMRQDGWLVRRSAS